MATGFLKVEGDKIVDADANPIILRGAAIGGWMKSVSLPSHWSVEGQKQSC